MRAKYIKESNFWKKTWRPPQDQFFYSPPKLFVKWKEFSLFLDGSHMYATYTDFFSLQKSLTTDKIKYQVDKYYRLKFNAIYKFNYKDNYQHKKDNGKTPYDVEWGKEVVVDLQYEIFWSFMRREEEEADRGVVVGSRSSHPESGVGVPCDPVPDYQKKKRHSKF